MFCTAADWYTVSLSVTAATDLYVTMWYEKSQTEASVFSLSSTGFIWSDVSQPVQPVSLTFSCEAFVRQPEPPAIFEQSLWNTRYWTQYFYFIILLLSSLSTWKTCIYQLVLLHQCDLAASYPLMPQGGYCLWSVFIVHLCQIPLNKPLQWFLEPCPAHMN